LSGSFRGYDIMKFLRDEKAVSEILGALMILLIIVLYIGTLQAYDVPKWNKEIEASNFNIVYDDILSMRQAMMDTAVYDMPRTAVLHTSLDYPNRMFLHNAGKPAASITALNDQQVTITYNTSYNGTSSTFTNTMSTCTIKVREDYNYYSVPEIIIEHSMIIGSDGIGKMNFMIDSPLLNNNEIDLSLVQCNNMSVGTTSAAKLALFPVSFNKTDFSSASLYFSTNYPELWENYLMSIGFPSSNYSITGNTINMFYSNASKLKIIVTSIKLP
jgi:hypothetical protein